MQAAMSNEFGEGNYARHRLLNRISNDNLD
jgi:hypothetical protein